jgi:hypothetical protein
MRALSRTSSGLRQVKAHKHGMLEGMNKDIIWDINILKPYWRYELNEILNRI